MWKNIVEPGGSHKTIWRMHFACWITKATDTHSEYVIFIAFPRQQWLRERALLLHVYVHCLSCLTAVASVVLWNVYVSPSPTAHRNEI